MAAISLRDALVADAPEIARVHVESWEAAYRGLISDAELDARTVAGKTAEWRQILGDNREVLVAVDGGAIVGFCAPRRDTVPPAQPVEIGALYLDPEHFRRGIGTRLLEAMLDRLRAHGDIRVTLWVLEGNVPARAFYARHGFAETGEREQWHGVPELRMARALTS
jgi:ribosomal protein S18 acetylase RimI-like enzyme